MPKILFLILILLSSKALFSNQPDSLKALLSQTKDKEDKAMLLNKIADSYLLSFDIAKAIIYADSALKTAPKNCNPKIISNAYVNIGNAYYFKGDLDSTLHYYNISYQKISESNDENEIASSLNRLGLIYEAKGEYQQASKFFLESLQIFEKTENQKGIANVYNNLGIINDRLQNFTKSQQYYNSALKIYQKEKDKLGEANVLNNIATAYTDLQNYDTALIYAKKSLVILKEIKATPQIATSYNNIGALYSFKELYDSALFYMKKSLAINTTLDSKMGKANDYMEIANILFKQQKHEEALNYYFMVLDISQKTGSKLKIIQTLQKISKTYEKTNDFKKALEFSYKYIQLKDSILNAEMEYEISKLQLKYDTEKKDKEIKLLMKDAQIRRNFVILLIAIITGLLVISIMFFYLFKTKTKLLRSKDLYYKQQDEINRLSIQKQKTEKQLLEEEVKQQQHINRLQEEKHLSEIQHKNRELATSAMHLINKNNTLSSIQKPLEEISQNADTSFKKNAKKLIREINQNINLDSDWEQFKLNFEKVNPNFFQNLLEYYPNLTKNDLKVCAYIRINLSSKEIAQMLNITLGGVNKRLYRLRKKLNITAEINLNSFLLDY